MLDAPAEDGEGRPAILRYSRKTKEQYVMTEEEGKATGWQAFFVDGVWRVTEPKKAEPKAAAAKKAPAKKATVKKAPAKKAAVKKS